MSYAGETEQVIDDLTKTLGKLIKEVTGRQVYLQDESDMASPEGEYIGLELMILHEMNFNDNIWVDEDGITSISHNYEIVYNVIAYRGNTSAAISKITQSFKLPYLYYKYFPEGSFYSFSSVSNINKIRVPSNYQNFENRSSVLITFNAKFISKDIGEFEEIEKVIFKTTIFDDADKSMLTTIDGSTEINI